MTKTDSFPSVEEFSFFLIQHSEQTDIGKCVENGNIGVVRIMEIGNGKEYL